MSWARGVHLGSQSFQIFHIWRSNWPGTWGLGPQPFEILHIRGSNWLGTSGHLWPHT